MRRAHVAPCSCRSAGWGARLVTTAGGDKKQTVLTSAFVPGGGLDPTLGLRGTVAADFDRSTSP